MMHVVEPLTVKSSDNVHDIAEDNGAMKGSRLWLFCAYGIYFGPLSLVDVKLMDVVESLLVCVNSSKNVDLAATNDSRVSIARLRRGSIRPVDLIPVIRKETVLKDIVHGVVPVPTTKYEHRVLEDDSRVAEAIQRLDTFALDLFPLVLAVLDAALVHVTESLLPVIAAVNEETAIPKDHCVVCPLARHLSTL